MCTYRLNVVFVVKYPSISRTGRFRSIHCDDDTSTFRSGGEISFRSDNDSERDGEEEDDAFDNDLEILGEQSGTVDVTNSTGDASGGTETPVKKSKTMLT